MNSINKLYDKLKPQAVVLRREGKMFSEIQKELGMIPKGTLSGWLKNIELTEGQKARIRAIRSKNGSIGRQLGAWMNHQKRIDRLAAIKETALAEYTSHLCNPNFLAGLVLYLAEGTKKNEVFMFMNSDPMLVRFMMAWVTAVGRIDPRQLKFRLYIHELYAHEDCESFWMRSLNARPEQFLRTIYKPTGRVRKKNPTYKGCLRMEVRGSELYWKTMAWRDCFYASLK